MTRAILILTMFILTAGKLLACGGSFQYRLFPNGTTNDKLVIIETSLNRYWGPDTAGTTLETRDSWRGTITLKTMNRDGQFDDLQVPDTVDILDMDYITDLKPFYETAFMLALKRPAFQTANNPIIEFCNFKAECKTIDLTSSQQDKLTIETAEKEELEVVIPQTVIQQSETSGGMGNQSFKINSIRTITVGQHKLIVANFASGEEHNTDFDTQTKEQIQCSSLDDCIYKEVTLYHGLSFDAVIWN